MNYYWINSLRNFATIDSYKKILIDEFKLFAYRQDNRLVEPTLADEDYMDGWINNARNRGLSNEITQKIKRASDSFGALL